MQHLDPECIVLPLHQQASQHAVSPTDQPQQPQQYENYYYQDQQAMAHQIQQPPCGQNYTVQPSAETGYGPCCSSLSESASPCSSETFYEASICSQNSPLAEDDYTNKCQDDDDEGMRETPQSDPEKKKKKKKKPRENKAWTNPMVTAGVHVSLMHENSLRVEKALPGKKGKYFCSHCKGQFRTILDLCAHMDAVSVRRPFHCPDTDCPWHVAGFPTASEWCRHTRFQHHRGEGKDVEKLGCESCGKKFTRKDSLKRHYILVHENENSRYNSKLRKQEERRFKKKKKRQQRQQSCSV